jgi:hypothetical protein
MNMLRTHTHCFSDLILETKWTHKLNLVEIVNNGKLTELYAPDLTLDKKLLVSIHGSMFDKTVVQEVYNFSLTSFFWK